MNKYLIIFWGIVLLLFSCKNTPSPFSTKPAVIKGKIENSNKKEIFIVGQQEMTSIMTNDGSFEQEIDIDRPNIMSLTVGNYRVPVFVKPGKIITIIGDINKPFQSVLEGDFINENQYLNEFSRVKQTFSDRQYDIFFSQNESDFIKSVENRTQKLIEHSQEYQKNNGAFDADFLDLLNSTITFEAAILKMNYPTYFKYFNPDSTLTLSETYDSFLQNIDHDNAQQLTVPGYHDFLPVYLDYIVKADTTLATSSLNIRKYNQVEKNFTQSEIKSKLYIGLAEEMVQTSVNDLHEIKDDLLKKNIQPAQKVDQIIQNYNNLKHLIKGMNAPDDTFVTAQGQNISFSDFKGKTLYIDVWATWCGPCLAELPFLDKKQEEYKNKDVVFISISVDDQPEPWKQMVKDRKLKGQQWYAPKSWQSALALNYRINGIPRFIVIDKNGKIFDAFAPRPSFEEFDNVINLALEI